MTLIAFVTPDNHPFLLADVLASTTGSGLRQGGLHLPGGDTVPFDVLEHMTVRPAGFTRKVTEILPNLTVAWSGSLDQATELIFQMRHYFQYQELTRDSLSQFVTVTASDYKDVKGICLALIGERCIASVINSPREGTSPSYNYYIVAGSGTKQFIKLMKKTVRPFGEMGHPIVPALHICHHFYSRELEDFSTIKENFGAAFEIIYLEDGELRRVDDLLHVIVSIRLRRHVIQRVGFHTPFFRQWYQGPHLIAASIARGGSGSESLAYLVPDLLTEVTDISGAVAAPPLPPKYLCLQHVIENDGRRSGLLYVAEGEHINRLMRFDHEQGRIYFRLTDEHRELIAKWSADKLLP